MWLTPTEDASICIDYNGDGNVDNIINVTELASVDLTDPSDDDMTGAVIWAVQEGESCTSENIVRIVVAWGQDPFRSNAAGNFGLDSGCKYEGLRNRVTIDTNLTLASPTFLQQMSFLVTLS